MTSLSRRFSSTQLTIQIHQPVHWDAKYYGFEFILNWLQISQFELLIFTNRSCHSEYFISYIEFKHWTRQFKLWQMQYYMNIQQYTHITVHVYCWSYILYIGYGKIQKIALPSWLLIGESKNLVLISSCVCFRHVQN